VGYLAFKEQFGSAFLIKSGLSKEAYIATGVVIASLVDFTRLNGLCFSFYFGKPTRNLTLLISATLSAIAGAYFGKKLLKKVNCEAFNLL
jgi:uncharacterized membrane protein YfcA